MVTCWQLPFCRILWHLLSHLSCYHRSLNWQALYLPAYWCKEEKKFTNIYSTDLWTAIFAGNYSLLPLVDAKYLDLSIRDGAANAAWWGCNQTSQKHGPEIPPICAVFWPSLTHTTDPVNFNGSNWPLQVSKNIFLNTNNSFISVSLK